MVSGTFSIERDFSKFISVAILLFFMSFFLLPIKAHSDECLANPDWGIILTDHGYSDILMDLRIVDGESYQGREYLSGEYAHAVGYSKTGIPEGPTWLEPDFIFPDWTSNSDYTVVSPIALVGANAFGLPVFESVVTNGDLEIKIISEMLDNGAAGIQNGMTAASELSVLVPPITSNKYVMLQRFEYTNISDVLLEDVTVYQMLHGLVSLVGLFDDRPYPPADTDPLGLDAAFFYDTTVVGQDNQQLSSFADPSECIPGALPGSTPDGTEHFDVLTFHTSGAPSAVGNHYYGSRSAGDNHASGKPSIGTHLDIEAGLLNALDFFDPGDTDYPPFSGVTPTYGDTDPDDFWVAGAQEHGLGDLPPGATVSFDYLLSLQTATVNNPVEEKVVPIPAYVYLILCGLILAIRKRFI